VLQIATGKFYDDDLELYRTPHSGVFYTNYWIQSGEYNFHSCIGNLEHIRQVDDTNIFVYEVIEKREKFDAEGKPGAMISTGGYEIVTDYMRLIAFGLNATVVHSSSRLEELLSDKNAHKRNDLIPRMFDSHIRGDERERIEFQYLANRLISLNRAEYVSAMNAIRRYVSACERISDDKNAAYSLFVSTIESLAQGYDQYMTSWLDVESGKRRKLDKEFENLDAIATDAIKDILIEEEHHAISRKFRRYACDMTDSNFYRKEAVGISGPISENDLDSALKNSYQARSRYLHTLEAIPEIISAGISKSEVVDVRGKPYLSFSGLARLARHVIFNFIYSQPFHEDESYDYQKDIPGVVGIPMHMLHPRGWVHQTSNFKSNQANDRLRGFLFELMLFSQGKDEGVTNLTDLMLKIEEIEPGLSNEEEKQALSALYLLYHKNLSDDNYSDDAKEYIQRYSALLNKPSIYSLLVHAHYRADFEWDVQLSADIIESYFETKHHRGRLFMHYYDEALILLLVASMHFKSNRLEAAVASVDAAVRAYPGNEKLIALEDKLATAGEFPQRWWDHI